MVVLNYYLGLPISEVAVVLRIPIGTVKSRLHRSLNAMRAEITTESPSTGVITEGQFA